MSSGKTRRLVRSCSRTGCRNIAVRTLTYIYSDSTAVLGPLATYAEPHAYDLCEIHSEKLTVPMGWTVLQHHPESYSSGPSEDDLMAIAEAIREVGLGDIEKERTAEIKNEKSTQQGRRGHLRVLPS
jgi:hypothetical protein